MLIKCTVPLGHVLTVYAIDTTLNNQRIFNTIIIYHSKDITGHNVLSGSSFNHLNPIIFMHFNLHCKRPIQLVCIEIPQELTTENTITLVYYLAQQKL